MTHQHVHTGFFFSQKTFYASMLILEVKIDLGKGLSKREQMVPFNAARSCEVRKILSGETTFDYKLINGEQSEKAA